MVSFHSFLAAVTFLLSQPALITAAPSGYPEPIIFSGLTREEFLQKRAEHHGRLAKRAYVLQEFRNEQAKNYDGQRMIELRSQDCVERWGEPWRAFRGTCNTHRDKIRPLLDFSCQIPPSVSGHGLHRVYQPCSKDQTCEIIDAWNYAGMFRTFPYCKDKFKIEKRPGPEVEIPPRYEGWKELPDKDWLMHQDLQSPGTIDFHFELSGTFNSLKTAWEYRGRWDNGWSFILASVGLVSTFSCLGCPKGTLYAETIGFKSLASGFVF